MKQSRLAKRKNGKAARNELREFRSSHNLSVAQIANCIGYSTATLYRWESMPAVSSRVSLYEHAINKLCNRRNKK